MLCKHLRAYILHIYIYPHSFIYATVRTYCLHRVNLVLITYGRHYDYIYTASGFYNPVENMLNVDIFFLSLLGARKLYENNLRKYFWLHFVQKNKREVSSILKTF